MAYSRRLPADPSPGAVLPSGDELPIETLALALVTGDIPPMYDEAISTLTDEQFEELWAAFARMRSSAKP